MLMAIEDEYLNNFKIQITKNADFFRGYVKILKQSSLMKVCSIVNTKY